MPMNRTLFRSLTLMGSLLVCLSSSGQFTVDSTQDGTDSNVGDGVCQTATGECTLRAALQEAEAAAASKAPSSPTAAAVAP